MIGSKLLREDQIDNDMDKLEKDLKKTIFEDQTENFIGCMLGSK